MKKTAILIGALACCLSSAALAHDHIRKIRIPDIEGYKTLVCEFHTHTIYSDGSVMPSVRVGEALNEGIHVIAVTEHIEDYCRKIPETNPVDLNTSYNLYKEAAEGTGLIVIRGGEISRGMPPGHLNALFLKDVNPLNTEYADQGAWDAVEEAASQGAFIIWNHPGWKPQQPDSTCWFDFHTRMHERGWLHGIEICNYLDGCYPETLTWYGEKNLAPIAGSDTHGPTFYEFDLVNSHRPVTLVFAREQTEEGVREALFDRRSVAYDNNFLYGAERWLQAIFRASVRCKESGRADGCYRYVFENTSDIEFQLVLKQGRKVPESITLQPHACTEVLSESPIGKAGYECLNMFHARDVHPTFRLLVD